MTSQWQQDFAQGKPLLTDLLQLCCINVPDCVETLGMTWLRYVRWGPFLTGTATLVPMHHIEGLDRDQAQLLPARVDDYVEADNPVRFIDAFVDGLDLE